MQPLDAHLSSVLHAPGLLHCHVLQVDGTRPLRRAHVCVKDSHGAQVQTSVSDAPRGEWNEGFPFSVSFHMALFGTLQFDVLETGVLYNSHVGRVTLRIADVLACGLQFQSWYELTSKSAALLAVSGASSRDSATARAQGAGAIQLGFHFFPDSRTGSPAPAVGSSSGSVDGDSDASSSACANSEKADEDEDEDDASLVGPAPVSPLPTPDGPPTPAGKVSEQMADEEEALFMDPRQTASERRAQGFELVDKMFFLSRETRTVIKAVRRMLVAYGQGLGYSNVRILGGLVALEAFYSSEPPPRTCEYVTDFRLIQTATHFFRFALAAYGWWGLNFFGKRSSIVRDAFARQADLDAVLEYLRLPPESILAHAFASADIAQRSYFVATDPLSNSLVLAVRGTMSRSDTLIDLACEYKKWRGGFVHAGVKASANWFFKHIVPQCVALAKERGLERLVVTGHSLGAGVASFLVMMLHERRQALNVPAHWVIEAFCYSPPATVSANLVDRHAAHVFGFVYDMDMVPRLSYGSMMDLKTLLIGLMDGPSGSALQALGDVATGIAGDRRDALFASIRGLRAGLDHRERNAKLYVPGTLFWLYTVAEPRSGSAGASVPTRSTSLASPLPPEISSGAELKGSEAVFPSQIELAHMVTAEPGAAVVEDGAGVEPANARSRWGAFLANRQVVMERVSATQFGELWLTRSALLSHLPTTIGLALETLNDAGLRSRHERQLRQDRQRQEQSRSRMALVRGSFG